MANSFSGPVVVGWQVGVPSGWGTYGLNLALQLADKGIEVGLPFLAQTLDLTEDQEQQLRQAISGHATYAGLASAGNSHHFESPFLRALGDGLDFPSFWSPGRDPRTWASFFSNQLKYHRPIWKRRANSTPSSPDRAGTLEY